MEPFRIGDFIRLKDITRWRTGRLIDTEINAFELSEINGQQVQIKGGHDLIPFDGIEPIPIDGKSDRGIYYDPIIAARIVHSGEEIPVRRRDKQYYFEKFIHCVAGDQNFQELVKEQHLSYVHEVQHLLADRFQDKGLAIDAM